MKTVFFTKPSPLKRESEDALIANAADGIYGVLDGVTPLASLYDPAAVFTDENGHNGAYLAANLFKACLEEPGKGRELTDRIRDANRRLRGKMLDYGIDLEIRHELWATCIAAVQVLPDTIRFAQLGDCMALARYADGHIKVLTKDLVKGLSERAKAKRERDRKNGLDVKDESYYANPIHSMIYNRWLANTPDGYGVANGMEEAGDYMQSGLIDREGLTEILLISDGMFYPGLTLESAMELMLAEGFERYVEKVEQAEREKGIRPDDRSAVLLKL
jgi:hypothetical protein